MLRGRVVSVVGAPRALCWMAGSAPPCLGGVAAPGVLRLPPAGVLRLLSPRCERGNVVTTQSGVLTFKGAGGRVYGFGYPGRCGRCADQVQNGPASGKRTPRALYNTAHSGGALRLTPPGWERGDVTPLGWGKGGSCHDALLGDDTGRNVLQSEVQK
jgi:hypothetical protein